MSGLHLRRVNRLKHRFFIEDSDADLRNSEQWKQVRDVLFRILAPYPEIRSLAARELMKLDLAGQSHLEEL